MYERRDTEALGEHYQRHIQAMTAEGLHEKNHIAAELAWRDAEIERIIAASRDNDEKAEQALKVIMNLLQRREETLTDERNRLKEEVRMTHLTLKIGRSAAPDFDDSELGISQRVCIAMELWRRDRKELTRLKSQK